MNQFSKGSGKPGMYTSKGVPIHMTKPAPAVFPKKGEYVMGMTCSGEVTVGWAEEYLHNRQYLAITTDTPAEGYYPDQLCVDENLVILKPKARPIM